MRSLGRGEQLPGLSGANAAASYSVLYRLTGSTVWTSTISGVTGTAYGLAGLQPATSYDFSVVGVNPSGSGPASVVVSATTASAQITVPSQVTGLVASPLSGTTIQLSWTGQSGTNAATAYTVQYRLAGTTPWIVSASGVSTTNYSINALIAGTAYEFTVFGANTAGAGPASVTVAATTFTVGSTVSSITWNVGPSGTFAHGSGAIGLNAHITPSTASVQFGFSASSTVLPTAWVAAVLVNTDLWGAYVPTPATAGTWYAWVEGIDGSCPTVYPTPFTVQ